MAKPRKSCHTVEFPLTTTESDRHRLERRFAAANTLDNGLLEIALRSLDACRADPAWNAARKLAGKTRTEAFKAVRHTHGLTLSALAKAMRQMRNGCWIEDHLESRLGDVIVAKVLRSIDRHLYEGAGRPRFRRADDCRSVSANKHSPIRLVGSPEDGLTILWNGLTLPIRRHKFSPSEIHALSCKRLYCRIMRHPSGHSLPRSPWRYAVQLVVEGKPYVHRPRAQSGVVGIDFGPGTVAAVFHDTAENADPQIIHLAQEVDVDDATIRRAGRRLDRSIRATNPDSFDAAGRCVRRPKKRSRRYTRERERQRRREARAVRHRRNCHGRDTNRILTHAVHVRIEDHGARGFSGLWGKSVGRKAPGLFISELKRKALDVDGSVMAIDCRKAKLSQFDHTTQTCSKKPLSQRFHAMGDGSGFVQRDLYSAFLAAYCNEEGNIDISSADRHWKEGVCNRLVWPTAAQAANVGKAAKASGLRPKLRLRAATPTRRQSGSDGSSAVPTMRAGLTASRGGTASKRMEASAKGEGAKIRADFQLSH